MNLVESISYYQNNINDLINKFPKQIYQICKLNDKMSYASAECEKFINDYIKYSGIKKREETIKLDNGVICVCRYTKNDCLLTTTGFSAKDKQKPATLFDCIPLIKKDSKLKEFLRLQSQINTDTHSLTNTDIEKFNKLKQEIVVKAYLKFKDYFKEAEMLQKIIEQQTKIRDTKIFKYIEKKNKIMLDITNKHKSMFADKLEY